MQPVPAEALLSLFLSQRVAPAPSRIEAAELADALAAALSAAQAAWPGVTVDPAAYLAFLASRMEAEANSERSLAAQLAALHTADLYLVCGCIQGDAHALRAFDTAFLREVPRFIGHLDRAPAFCDEVAQVLRAKLLVRDGEKPPGLDSFGGRGPLTSWLRAAAVRAALNLRRRKIDQATDSAEEVSERILIPGQDPELDFIKARYRDEFKAALREAFSALSDEQRNVLHLHVVGGLSTPRIATLFKVNQSTVSRWIAAARESIFTQTRTLLGERLGLRTGEFESLVRLLRSQLDLSIGGLLSTSDSEES
jgi:RNA polymerase sigma-70 factor (ECF subfamily)